MALQKTPIAVNFAQGLDTKSDPNQVPLGKFLALQNSVFDRQGALTKRNGFANITTLPNDEQTTLTTLNDNLLATGSNLYAYSQDTNRWLNQGSVQPVQLAVQPLVRVSTSQTAPDAAVASSGLVCLAYVDSGVAYYQVSDSTTGQQVVARTALPATAADPKVFLLGRYFIITFTATVSASPHLQYVAVPVNAPQSPLTATDISTSVSAVGAAYDAVVANNSLYLAWDGAGTTMQIAYLTSTLGLSPTTTVTSMSCQRVSLTVDDTTATPTIWLTYWRSSTSTLYTRAYNPALVSILGQTTVTASTINAVTSSASGGAVTIFYTITNNYSSTGAYPTPGIRTDYTAKAIVDTAGTVLGPSVIRRSVGLASKSFIDEASGSMYMLVAYGETNQPTYFLIDSSGNIIMRLAAANGGGYASSHVLASVSSVDGTLYVPYLIKTFLASVNKGTSLPTGTPTSAIYTQTGVNLATFTINEEAQYSAEIANALHLTGGQLWEYDGVRPVEHGFHVYPENIASATATGAGGLIAQTYYYSFCYEWTDNQGNLHRSAPSIPTKQVTTTGSSTNTLYVPTLRLTAKLSPNPVRIVGYRWSTAQPTYYQFTSLTSPTANDTTVDYVTIVDANADSAILGNTLLYTTGGVIENTAAPASTASALFKNRLFLINAEDPNVLSYSKQVLQATPVEMSDLLTKYVAPTTGAQGSTGPMKCLAAMDDKLIIFKKSAINYIVGDGPSDTGLPVDGFSDAVFVTASVGCSNPSSIVLTPNGIMFQSEKGIWLLGRDLTTQYIGAPVEAYNNVPIKSATSIPSTNQVRFILSTGTTLVYDYYRDQWSTFSNIRALSATLYQSKHTYLNAFGQVLQEAEGTYLDGSQPVTMSFTMAWCNVAGLQGYERFYQLFLLGKYLTPFKLNVSIAYDYNPSVVQSTVVTPDNYTPAWGDEAVWGSGGPWGGTGNVFEARVFPTRQKCQSFQVSVQEIYDPSMGVAAGAGLSLSGMTLLVGGKKGVRVQKAGRSFGGG